MKKQIITIISVALAAVLLFTVYSIFLRDDGIQQGQDEFYNLTDEVKNTLAQTEEKVKITVVGYNSADVQWEMLYRYCNLIADAGNKISVETAGKTGDFAGVTIDVNGQVKEIVYDDFFKKLYDGTQYAFDGENLIVNTILSLSGKDNIVIDPRPLSGFDKDGDYVTTSGAPFIFKSVERAEISYLTITNSHGDYSIYQDKGKFYFGDSRAISYNDEAFSLLTTNCRYPVCYGKMEMPEGKDWADYGINGKDSVTATYSLMTTDDKEGNYTIHTVEIGQRSSSGNYYFARYIGGVFKPSGKSDQADELVHNLTKDIMYLVPVDVVEGSLALPKTDIMKPNIVNPIGQNEALLNIDNIRIDYYDEGIHAIAQNVSYYKGASNLIPADSSALTKVICDKVSVTDYSKYEGGWQSNLGAFAAFRSNDNKSTFIKAALVKQAVNGEYKVVFGLLRDEAAGAYLPAKVTISKSYDGINWTEVENGSISVSHADKTVKKYELSFKDETLVKYVRIGFDVPQLAQTCVVFDEIRIYADGDDAQPIDSVGGTWKLTSPAEYIPAGKNYAHLDMVNFNDFIQYLASLEGERVVDCGFADNGDANATLIKTEILAKYGLDKPSKHFSFEYNGYVTDIYVSKPNEEGKYYAYSTFSGDLNGKDVVASTDVIVELSDKKDNTKWLSWDFVEFLDHSLFSIYIADITQMDVTMDGTTYSFYLNLDSTGGDIQSVIYNDQSYDVRSFKYLYQSMLSIYMQDEYVPAEGDTNQEYLRIKIYSETNSPEIVFYRDTSTKCHFTVDGEGSYYALVEDVNEVRTKLIKYISGEIIEK